MRRRDGGPAFPVTFEHSSCTSEHDGMTLRDYFAAQAMAAVLSNPANYGSGHEWRDAATVSEQAYEIADDMLAERNK